MARTIQDILCAALEARGHTEVVRESGSYRRFERVVIGGKATSYYFVGVNGGLRIGRNKTESRSIGDAGRKTDIYKELLVEGEATLNLQKLGVTDASALDF